MPALQIILDGTTAYPPGSGSERYTRNLVRALVALKSAHMYTLLSNTRPTLSDELSAETVFRRRGLAPGGAFWPMLWQRARLPLPADLFTGHADLWHGLHFSLPPLRRGKRVVTVPDLAFLTHPDMVEPTLAAYLRRVAERAVQRADAILTLSAFTRQALLEQLRVPAEHVHLALPGVSAGFARITDTMLLEATRHKFELQPPVLLTVGTLGPRKNLVRLIEAFDTIHREPSGPKLLAIVGANGWGYQPVYEAVNRRGLQQQVRFLPAVSDLELVLLYSLADLVVLPSLYEGVGLAVLEAMACGAPVLCSNTTALAEAAGDAALLVTPTDTEALAKAMLRLLRNSSLRALLSKKGLAQAAKFRWDACALDHLKVYEGLAAGKEGSMTSQSVAGPANRA